MDAGSRTGRCPRQRQSLDIPLELDSDEGARTQGRDGRRQATANRKQRRPPAEKTAKAAVVEARTRRWKGATDGLRQRGATLLVLDTRRHQLAAGSPYDPAEGTLVVYTEPSVELYG